MDRAIAAIREDLGTSKERAAERATIKAVRWSTAKLLALVGVVAVSAGGGIVTTLRARDVIAHAEGRREQRLDDFEREVGRRFDAVNVDLDRLYLLFKMPRTAPQEPHE